MGLAIHDINYKEGGYHDRRDKYSQYVLAHNFKQYWGKWKITKNSDGTYSIMFISFNNGW